MSESGVSSPGGLGRNEKFVDIPPRDATGADSAPDAAQATRGGGRAPVDQHAAKAGDEGSVGVYAPRPRITKIAGTPASATVSARAAARPQTSARLADGTEVAQAAPRMVNRVAQGGARALNRAPQGGAGGARVVPYPTAGSEDGARPRVVARAVPQPRPPAPTDRTAPAGPVAAASQMAMMLPKRRAKKSWGVRISFLICVALPTLVVTLYYFVLAANQYTSEFRFSVFEQQPALPGASQPAANNSMAGSAGGTSITTVTSAMSSGGLLSGSGSTQNFVVVDFATSRAAAEKLDAAIHIRQLLSKANHDPLYALKPDTPMDDFVPYWQSMIDAYYDPVTALAYIRVRGFTPEDSLLISTTLMKLAEDLINDIANRANNDAVKFAADQVVVSEAKMKAAAKAIADYRNASNVIDPSNSAVQSNINLIMSQRADIQAMQTQLSALEAQSNLSPQAPVAAALRTRIAADKANIARLERDVRVSRPDEQASADGKPLASLMGSYEKLDLERQYANSAYLNALFALDQARANAVAKHIYLTPYSDPYIATKSNFPNRPLSIFITFLIIFGVWLTGLLTVRAIRDHQI